MYQSRYCPLSTLLRIMSGDVWSFGITMYEVLSRSVPYYQMSNREVVDFVCEEGKRLDKPSLFEYPNELFEIMTRVTSIVQSV